MIVKIKQPHLSYWIIQDLFDIDVIYHGVLYWDYIDIYMYFTMPRYDDETSIKM